MEDVGMPGDDDADALTGDAGTDACNGGPGGDVFAGAFCETIT